MHPKSDPGATASGSVFVDPRRPRPLCKGPSLNPMSDDEEVSDQQDAAEPSNPVMEGEDYYLEGALMVFTERFLLRRGFCCESGCRHCPYGFKKET